MGMNLSDSDLLVGLRKYVDEIEDGLVRRPGMWGPGIAVELQLLLILEIKTMLVARQDPKRDVMTRYREFIQSRLPDCGPQTVSDYLEDDEKIYPILREFRDYYVEGLVEAKT